MTTDETLAVLHVLSALSGLPAQVIPTRAHCSLRWTWPQEHDRANRGRAL